MKALFISLAASCLALSALAQDLTSNQYGKGIAILASDSSFSMKFNTRFQTLFIADIPEEGGLQEAETNWLIRRARLKFSGFAFSPKLQYKMELGLSNRDHGGVVPQTNNTSNIILDAFIRWRVYKKFEIWAGQTKLPGNRERVISSQALQLVDRSLVNSRFNIDRDMGIQLRNEHSVGGVVVREAVALSQGEGRNRTAGNQGGFEYTGRVEVLPLGKFTSKGDYFGSDLKREEKPKISFGATYDYNDKAPRERGNLGSYVPDTAYSSLSTFMADMMFKYAGFSVMAEFAQKEAVGTRLVDDEGDFVSNYYTGSGYTAQVGYLFKNNVEIVGRLTSITPEKMSGRDVQDMYTLGINKFIVNHYLKVQTDFSLLNETDQFTDDQETSYIWRFQFEVAF